MSDKYPSLSPYVYCANNPVKLVDPNGEEIGNYYDVFGHLLGSDGNDDKKIYLVSDQQGVSKDKQGNIVVNNSESVHELPDKKTRNQIIAQLKSNNSKDPNSESGGCYGGPWSPENQGVENYHVEWGETNHYDPPCDKNSMDYHQIRPENFVVVFDFHCHGSGSCKLDWGVFENVWTQAPSPKDCANSSSRAAGGRTFAVFGMRSEKVYFYNKDGTYAVWSFDQFRDNE